MPRSSVNREVATLVDLGLVTIETDHGRRLLRADTESEIFPELSPLVRKTAAPSIVEAHLYGSWARQHAGEPRPAPGDIDVLVIDVVGTVDIEDVRRRADAAGQQLAREVNVTVLRPEE